MSYREKRRVILPNGFLVTEVRMLDDGEVTYVYEMRGIRPSAFLRGCNVEYNGQILDACELEWKGQEDE